jgi:hypothetical protein
MPGLDPGIWLQSARDPRVKPAGDDWGVFFARLFTAAREWGNDSDIMRGMAIRSRSRGG